MIYCSLTSFRQYSQIGMYTNVYIFLKMVALLHTNFRQRNWWTEESALLELLEIDEPDILTTAPVDAKKLEL